MIKTLYEKFQEWSKKGSIYIYSDTHFEDNDCKLMDPNWITPQEQIDIINKLIGKADTFILLGDVGNVEWVKKIRAGYKVLITGNHDAGAENYKRKIEVFDTTANQSMDEAREMYPDLVNIYKTDRIRVEDNMPVFTYKLDNRLFDEVYTGPLMISDKIILSHEPIPNINWALNIHGHDHGGKARIINSFNKYYFNLDDGDIHHLNVCSNIIDYTPLNLKAVISSGILNKIDSLHRITIDKASDRRHKNV